MKLGNIILSVELVSPELSSKWMENNATNRRIRPAVVDQYSRDMFNERWELKPFAICFLPNGDLGNGQHTLSGIIMSGKSQTLLVARNCTKEQIAVLDVGIRRSITDVMHFMDMPGSRAALSIAKVVKFGPVDRKAKSFAEMWEAYEENREGIDFVCAHASGGKINKMPAASFGAICRAYYHVNTDGLARFIKVLSTGLIDGPHETSIIRLRDYLRSTAHSPSTSEETFNKTTSALDAFFAGRPMTKIYGTTKNLYPLSRPSESA